MPDKLDLDGLGQLVERVFGKAREQSKVWIGAWSAIILGVTTVIALFRAPTAAYLILVLVVLLVVSADGRPNEP